MDFQDKNVILTGANRGIGREILEQFVKSGANVWACIRKENKEFEEYCLGLEKKHGVWIEIVAFDLSEEAQIKAGIKTILSEKKKIDILVNNAGIAHGGLFQMTSMDTLRDVFQINYFAALQISQLVARGMMRQKSGVIINIASVGGIEANPGYMAYGSSKAALIWATKCMAKELGVYGIRVNAVAPGLTETSMGNYKSEEELLKVINRTSLRRMAKTDEIAKAVLYLASDDASFITGEILKADGGR